VKTEAAMAVCVVILAAPSMPAAFGKEMTSVAQHRRTLRRSAHRGVKSGAIASVASAAPAWTPFQGPFINPFATPPLPPEWPEIEPYRLGQGDTDGLSRNVDDCNKGCIDGPY